MASTSKLKSRMDGHDSRSLTPKVIGALKKLLMDSDLEDLLAFLHELHIQYTISVSPKGNFVCRIFKNHRPDGLDTENLFSYSGGSNQSVRAACCDAIADLLIRERTTDYHDWIFKDWPEVSAADFKSQAERIIHEKKNPKEKFTYIGSNFDALATLDDNDKGES